MLFDQTYLDSLYAHADAYIEENPYINAVTRDSFYTKVVGVTMEEGRQEAISRLYVDSPIRLVREAFNEHDPNAIAIHIETGEKIGYLKRQLALALAPRLDANENYSAAITSITGGISDQHYGCNIVIYKNVAETDVDWPGRARLTCLTDVNLRREIQRAVLGEYDFHEKQTKALEVLYSGENLLSVFGTGRGKSAIFQAMAAYKAIRTSQITIIVYPLRALANDQYLSMQSMFNGLGLRVFRANGSLATEDRLRLFDALKTGEMDVLLTTPEFLLWHQDKLAQIRDRIGLFVVDESHHISETHRPAYKRLGEIQELLGNPQTLAVTATANDNVAREIVETLKIGQMVVDDYERTNLEIVDVRNQQNKEAYLLDHIRTGKSVVYVGTRKDAVRIARLIREKVPEMTKQTGFYHGGMNSVDRTMIENAFRSGELRVIIATCAFGEGINIPDISDVYLFQMMYSLTEFNQMSGRCGRSGEEARIHTMFGFADGVLNQYILRNQAPDRETVAAVYRALRTLPGRIKNKEIADHVAQMTSKKVRINESGVSVSLGILEELGLIVREVEEGKRTILIKPNPPKTDIARSIRFQEGQEEFAEFQRFRRSILNMDGVDLLNVVRRPICPRRDIIRESQGASILEGLAWLD